MKDNPVLVTILAALALALVGGVVYAIWLIGREVVATLAGVLVGGIAAALVLAAVSLPIRAYRKNDAPPVIERHYRDGTRTVEKVHTIDGRAPAQTDVKLLQLPAAGTGAAFPELLRASYRAGLLAAPNGDQVTSAAPAAELRELDPATTTADDWGGGGWSDWRGELRP